MVNVLHTLRAVDGVLSASRSKCGGRILQSPSGPHGLEGANSIKDKNCLTRRARPVLEPVWAGITKYQSGQLINNRHVFLTALEAGGAHDQGTGRSSIC